MDRLTVDAATELQRMAADPRAPRIVNANAGSGKTKVLVDRVSRILLQGMPPDRILCLTYTRAAASEMQERLYDTLSKWSVASDADLRATLERLLGQRYQDITPRLPLYRVRSLFAGALETPEGLKVMTIHAFCERIIARFPVEAGILPGFSPLDEADGREMLAESRMRLLERARDDDRLADALHHLTRLKADSTLDEWLYGVARDFDRTERWVEGGGLDGFRNAAGLDAGDTARTIAEAAMNALDRARAERVFAIADRVWTSDAGQKNLKAYRESLRHDDPEQALTGYAGIFLTNDGHPRKRTFVAAVHKEDAFFDPDGAECQRVIDAVDRMKAARLVETTQAVLTLGYALGTHFEAAKHKARGLDFNDLIVKTRDLLKRKSVSEWIAYKLDGGVEHVLLDEAQDTSPTQWEIIDAIVEPFAQDSPDRAGPPRTFFAVGDPKQSIYRFQGAAPSIFMDSVRTRAGENGEIRLRMSFRSAQQVLDVVDALFVEQGGMQAMFDADSVPEASDLVRHDAYWTDNQGVVELWPLAPKSETLEEKEPWDTTPVDARGDADPRTVLARAIAEQIAHWIDRGEPVFDRDLKAHRPMHAGDVLILVQKRVGGLFDELIKALKAEGLPVAGADRLILQDATVVRDLLAITRFVLLPGDCLSLAEALKSPMFGLKDDQLFALCVDREGTLWEAIRDRAPNLAAHLQAIRDDGALAPYDFYARLLDRRNPDGLTYREALFRRLGMEAREALEAFLATALSHQQRQAPSLQRFLQAFTKDAIEIKRDKDPAGGEVRVMTVHGAKGLEAPVVFLPDTTRKPTAKSGCLIPDGEGGFILSPSASESFDLADRLKEADHAEAMREYMRLLYVAMTRAESRLVLCGHAHGTRAEGFEDESWYHWFLKTVPHLDGVSDFATPFDGEGRQGQRYGVRPDTARAVDPVKTSETPLPSWIDVEAANEARMIETASPSGLLSTDEPVGRGPGTGRFRRGILIHKLLEILPDHPQARRPELAAQIVSEYPELTDSERADIIAEVFGVLDNPEFADVFAEGSRAEVSLAGRVETIRGGSVFLTAQIDRLRVTPEAVYLVDYKSNRPPPRDVADVEPAYLAQLAAYRELAQAIWQDRTVRCGLLWTDAARMMWLPDTALDAALTQVNALPTSVGTISPS